MVTIFDFQYKYSEVFIRTYGLLDELVDKYQIVIDGVNTQSSGRSHVEVLEKEINKVLRDIHKEIYDLDIDRHIIDLFGPSGHSNYDVKLVLSVYDTIVATLESLEGNIPFSVRTFGNAGRIFGSYFTQLCDEPAIINFLLTKFSLASIVNIFDQLVISVGGFRDLAVEISEVKASDKVVLFPVKLTTKFLSKAEAQSDSDQLLVRIIPDSLLGYSFKEGITRAEWEDAEDFWFNALVNAVKAEALSLVPEKQVLTALTSKYGASRAVYILFSTVPPDWDQIINQIIQESNAIGTIPDDPTFVRDRLAEDWFPEIDFQEPSREILSEIKLLPNFFTATVLDTDGTVILQKEGTPIVEKVWVGFTEFSDPSITDPASPLTYSEESKWLVDYQTALESGLAITLNIPDGLVKDEGLPMLIVEGIRLGHKAAYASEQINELIKGHFYTSQADVIPVGSPTNIVESIAQNEPLKEARQYDVQSLFKIIIDISKHNSLDDDTDGSKLAKALGLNEEVLAKLPYARRQDQRDAEEMNRSIYDATLGGYLRKSLSGAIDFTSIDDKEAVEKFRHFFIKYVKGRGHLPSLRVGQQPYSFMLATNYEELDPSDEQFLTDKYYYIFRNLLDKWKELSIDLPSHDMAGSENPLEKLWKVFSQLPDSVEFAAEYFIKSDSGSFQASANYLFEALTDDQHPVYSIFQTLPSEKREELEAILHKLLTSPNVINLTDDWNNLVNIFAHSLFSADKNILKAKSPKLYNSQLVFAYNFALEFLTSVEDPGLSTTLIHRLEEFRKFLAYDENSLYEGKIIDQNLPDEEKDIQYLYDYQASGGNAVRGNFNYLRSLLAIESFSDFINELLTDRQGVSFQAPSPKPRALYYLLLYNSFFELLAQEAARWSTSSLNPNNNPNLFPANSEYPIGDYGWIYTANTTLKDLFNQAIDPAVGEMYGLQEVDCTIGNLVFVLQSQSPENLLFPNHLVEFRAALEYLKDVPRARLERCVIETLDCLTYRLDAWITGFASLVLDNYIDQGTSRTYTGCYGVLYNLKPRSQDRLIDIGGAYEDLDTLGYVHAPSVDQVVTSAILLQGYAAAPKNRNNPIAALRRTGDTLNINLSSLRARIGLGIIKGRLNGIDLGQYLGTLFEERLRSQITDLSLRDSTIRLFRRQFPSDPAIEKYMAYSPEARARMAEQNVTNGFTLLRALPNTTQFPYGVADLDISVKEQVEDALRILVMGVDAVSDHEMADKLHSFIYRRKENVTSPSDPEAKIQDPDFFKTLISGKQLKQNILIAGTTQALFTLPPQNFGEWDYGIFSIHGALQPGLERILEQLLFPRNKIEWSYSTYHDTANQNLAQTNLYLIDLYFLYKKDSTNFLKNMQEQIGMLHLFTEAGTPADYPVISVDFEVPSSNGSVNLSELAYHLEKVERLLSRSRALGVSDYSDSSAWGTISYASDQVNHWKAKIQWADHIVERIHTALVDVITTPANSFAALPAMQILIHSGWWKTISEDLEKNSNFRFKYFYKDIYLPYRENNSTANQTLFVSYINSFLPYLAEKKTEIRDLVLKADWQDERTDDDTGEILEGDIQKAQRLIEEVVGTRLYEELTDFQLDSSNARTIFSDEATIHNTSSQSLALSHWVYGVSRVRPNTNELREHFLDLEVDDLSAPLGTRLGLYQDKFSASSRFWSGAEVPAAYEILDGTRCFACLNAQAFAGNNGVLVLILESWEEVVPYEDQVTGVAFNYNQPDSEAPNAIMVAFQGPQESGWDSDSLRKILFSTLGLAKIRGVDTDRIKADASLGIALPAISNVWYPGYNLRNIQDGLEELDYTWINRRRY